MSSSYFSIFELPHKLENTKPTKTISEKELSKDQKEVYDKILIWLEQKDNKLLTMAGYAGTGKTTLLSCLARKLNRRVAFCTFTGKASSVLRNKLTDNGVDLTDSYVGTIHGLMYIPMIDEKTKRIKYWRRRANIDADLIIIDEASMVGQNLFHDLQSYNIKMLCTGDHGQLPPIKSLSNLMEKPQLKLEKIHRQAEDNPIIKLSYLVRTGQDIKNFKSNDSRVIIFKNGVSRDVLEAMISDMFKEEHTRHDSAIITYFNQSRILFNKTVRRVIGKTGSLSEGDLTICLKNTRSEDSAIFNGMRGIVKNVEDIDNHTIGSIIHFIDDGLGLDGILNKHQFNRKNTIEDLSDFEKYDFYPETWADAGLLMDFGYTLSCHKSQGSQFKTTLVQVERPSMINEDMFARWKYTAFTRASENLVIIL